MTINGRALAERAGFATGFHPNPQIFDTAGNQSRPVHLTRTEMQTYIFFREHNGKPVFYPVQLKDDEEAIKNAHGNPGTTKVERANGTVVWIAKAPQ